ncbi:MAG: class I SAM-dependent methyltransferase [Pseudomonadales bacterium]|nr:class I SAM-dependent methyltransferase [Pseudomonadales bacterium]
MRSEHADRFNHDDDAAGYDADVRDETHPIRTGYNALLTWVAAQVSDCAGTVVDLGCGTGNLSIRLAAHLDLIGVDISANMLAIARDKLANRNATFVQADLLGAFERIPRVDAIVSTYAVHHLTADEKSTLFRLCAATLAPGGRVVFGDLMFGSRPAATDYLQWLETDGQQALADDIRDEFFWYVDECELALRDAGFTVRSQRFSDLSWGISGRLV